MKTAYQTLKFLILDKIAIIQLNRPEKLNSFDSCLRKELLSAIEDCNQNNEIRVVLITATGKAFCAGADLTELLPLENAAQQHIETEYKPLFMAIQESSKLYISVVNGIAAGAGAAFALTADLCVMAENANLYQAFASIGAVPDYGCTWHFLRYLGPKRTLELILSGANLSAQRCLELGLANQVVAEDNLQDEALKLAQRLAQKSPQIVKYSKHLVGQASTMDLSEMMSYEANRQQVTELQYLTTEQPSVIDPKD